MMSTQWRSPPTAAASGSGRTTRRSRSGMRTPAPVCGRWRVIATGSHQWSSPLIAAASRPGLGTRRRDAHTGACLQTLNVGSYVNILSFDTTNSSLHTYVGIVTLRGSLTPVPTTPTKVSASQRQSPTASQLPQPPEYHGYGISPDGFWITRRSQNLLWLPPTYRPTCSAVGPSGLAMVVGYQSGRVLVFEFAPGDAGRAIHGQGQ
jgi:hypothetical protein